jgi:hypothetical protein
MTMICSLPPEYQSFTSLLQLLDHISKEKLQAAFINKKQLRSALNTTSSSLSHIIMQVSTLSCFFFGLQGHVIDTCHCFDAAKTQAIQNAKQKQEKHKTAKSAQARQMLPRISLLIPPGFSAQTGSARKASPTNLSLSCSPHSASDHLWTADTGVTFHMMLYKHWLHNYHSLTILIHLANNTIVLSAGVKLVVFAPEAEEQLIHHVKFSRVLHVPEVGSNLLLSVLFFLLKFIDPVFTSHSSTWTLCRVV